MTALELPVMAKSARKDEPTRIDKDVLRVARIVAAYREISLSEYLSEILRPLVNSHLAQHQRQDKKGERG